MRCLYFKSSIDHSHYMTNLIFSLTQKSLITFLRWGLTLGAPPYQPAGAYFDDCENPFEWYQEHPDNNDDTKCTISTHVAFRTTVANPGSGSGLPRNHQTAIRCLNSFSSFIIIFYSFSGLPKSHQTAIRWLHSFSSIIFFIDEIALSYYCLHDHNHFVKKHF